MRIKAVGEQMAIERAAGIRDLGHDRELYRRRRGLRVIGTAAVKTPGFLSDAMLRVSRAHHRRPPTRRRARSPWKAGEE